MVDSAVWDVMLVAGVLLALLATVTYTRTDCTNSRATDDDPSRTFNRG